MALLERKESRKARRRTSPVDYGRHEGDMERFVAAAVELRSKEESSFRTHLPIWQRQSLELYDLIGECWYPAQFYARMLSRVRLYAGERQPNGEVKELKGAAAAEQQKILGRIRDPGGGITQWKAQYGLLQFLIGDGNLVVSLDEEGDEQWEYLSPAEFYVEGTTRGKTHYKRKIADGKELDLYEAPDLDELSADTVRAWRLWKKHPTMSRFADAPMRGVIGLMRVLMLLDKAQEAQAVSRIVGSGLLVVDDRVTIASPDANDSDDSADDDDFMKLLTEYVVKPIGQPGSAAQMAPLVARWEATEGLTAKDMIALVQLHDPNQTADWQQRIEKVVTRIAIGLDMPPEEFLGLAQANHWTGWVITDEKWKAHGEPVTIRLCEDITAAYYRPACMAAELDNAANQVIWYDAAHVVTHPDRGKDALSVHGAGALSDAALRMANNFSEDDAPTDAEKHVWLLTKLRGQAQLYEEQQGDVPGVAATGSDVQGQAPSNNGPRTNQPTPQPQGQQMQAMAQGAALVALQQIRHRAGGKLRERKMSCDGCFNGTDEVPNGLLAATVGPDIVRMAGFSTDWDLVKGCATEFEATLLRIGMEKSAAKALASRLQRHAADSLYEYEADLPDDFAAVT